MKLSFLTTKPSSAKPQKIITTPEEEDPSSHNREQLIEFDQSKQTLNRSSKPITAIPLVPNSNEWRTTKKMKNLANLPTESDDPTDNLRFMVDPTSHGVSAVDPIYLLFLRFIHRSEKFFKKSPHQNTTASS